jgi:hypothetical protein
MDFRFMPSMSVKAEFVPGDFDFRPKSDRSSWLPRPSLLAAVARRSRAKIGRPEGRRALYLARSVPC